MSENNKYYWLLALIPIGILGYIGFRKKGCGCNKSTIIPNNNTSSSGSLGTACYCPDGRVGVMVQEYSGSLGLTCYCSGSLGIKAFTSWYKTDGSWSK